MLDLFHEIAQTLSHNKLRTALTGIAVAWGIFMLIVLLSLANGLVHSFQASMLDRDVNTISFFGGFTTKAFEGYKDGRQIQLEGKDMPSLKETDPKSIGGASAKIRNDTATFATEKDYISTGYEGVYPAAKGIQDLKIVSGRFINDDDLANRRKSVVLKDEQAVTLFGSAEGAVGRRLKSVGLSWTVVGVYHHDWARGSFVPFTTARMLAGNSDDVEEITVAVQNLSTAEQGNELEQNLRKTMGRRHSFDPSDESALWVRNNFTNKFQAMTVKNVLVIMMWVIGLLTLLSGIIGVSNIMFVSVKERTHEIGVRRAIGARRASILRQIVAESVVITTLAGYVGIVAGTLTMAGVSKMIGNSLEMLQNPSVDLSTAIEVTVVLIIAGALAGLFPALKATKIKPVEALRDE